MALGKTQAPVDGIELATRVATFFAPKPAPVKLIRVGGNDDGAYLVPSNLSGVGACFSPGVANRKVFEDELLRLFGIRSHLLDASSSLEKFETPLQGNFQSFRKEWLAPKTSEGSVSLDDWVHQAEPDIETDLILQMDIEGAEYENILGSSRTVLERFRVVVIEFHNVASMILGDEVGRRKLAQTIDSLENLFISIHARANNCCPVVQIYGSRIRVPEVLEVTLLRKDHLNSPSAFRVPMVPHLLDIRSNAKNVRPVHLRGIWRRHSSFFFPTLKVLMDWSSFLFQSVLPRKTLNRIFDRAYVRLFAVVRKKSTHVRPRRATR